MVPPELSDLRIAMQNSTSTNKVAMNIAAELVKNEISRKGIKKTVAAQFKSKRVDKKDKSKENLICDYCGKSKHVEENFWTKKNAEKARNEQKAKIKITAIQVKSCSVSQHIDNVDNVTNLDSGSQAHGVNTIDGFETLQKPHNF